VVLAFVLIYVNLLYSYEEIMNEEDLAGTTVFRFDVTTEHIELDLDREPSGSTFSIDYMIVEVATGRVVTNTTMVIYDPFEGWGLSWAHHHVINPGEYKLTIDPNDGFTGTYSVSVIETDLGPDEQSGLVGWSLLVMFIPMGIFGLMYVAIGWRIEEHTDIYGSSVILAMICLFIMMIPMIVIMEMG